MESQFKIPTETVQLPSKGLIYPKDSPLSKGEIEMKYMTAKEEDILTNNNYISNGTVIDKLLQALIITEGVNFNHLLIGDKNAIMIAARILSYGKDYVFNFGGKKHKVDLTELSNKEVQIKEGKNEFEFTLPKSENKVTFKLLTHKDEREIENEMKGLKKLNKDSSTETTTRLKHTLTSINGLVEKKDIREFVDKYLLASDARALRKFMVSVSPDVDLIFYPDDVSGGVDLPIGIGFFWPDV
tara:strand:- start:25 stop:750 length:726 start_codon:yes stop_codon:yes gene_type:complete